MVSWLRSRRSTIAFDLGAAGIRACQFQQRSGAIRVCDSLCVEHAAAGDPAGQADQPEVCPTAPVVDPAQLDRQIGRGNFNGRDVTLVLSPPEVQFFPLRLPGAALAQPAERVVQALKWEVAQESRKSADDLEVRYWTLPASRAAQANVMAVVMSSQTAGQWCSAFEQQHLTLRRIAVSPCALVHLARRLWTPGENDLWGVLDLGLRRSVLTVVVGTVPTYIRALSVGGHDWTRRLAGAFEVSYAVAEQLKREHGLRRAERGVRQAGPGGNVLEATDLPGAFFSVLHESLQALTHEVGRCFSYVMQSYPDVSLKRLLLAGDGANTRGLPGVLEDLLGMPVTLLNKGDDAVAWEHPLPGVRLEPRAAAALGSGLLDLGCPTLSGGGRSTPSINLVPTVRVHAQVRARRRRAWVGVCVLSGALAAIGWGMQRAGAGALARFSQRVSALEVQRGEVQRRLLAATGKRTELLDRLRTLGAARRPQPWAERLVRLTRETPDGVFLTQVNMTTASRTPVAAGAPAPSGQAAAPRRGGSGSAVDSEVQAVRVLGYAVDHSALLQLLNTVQSLPDWQNVELVRATQEPYRGGQVVAFELNCRAREEQP